LSGFKNMENTSLLFMQSDGGLTPVQGFSGSRAILSGPAGGVVGYANTTPAKSAVIGFDMGGTSTDVSRYAGELEHIFESVTGGVTIQAPQLDIVTVAAGGGSVLTFHSGLFYVGPESAGAHPGPACYRKNGPLAITDANLVLGRLLPQYFPCIFGPKVNQLR
jgi:5-oxoprolinase (ATP-hydrolysing)